MKSNFSFFSLVQFLCLLTICTVCAQDDFKSNFGKDFGVFLKRSNANFLQAKMDSFKELHMDLIEELNLSTNDEQIFRRHIEMLDSIKSRIGKSVTYDSLKDVTNYIKLVMFEMFMFGASPKLVASTEQSTIFREAIRKAAERDVKNTSIFINEIHEKWTEMYSKAPKEVLNKYPEFAELNISIEKFFQINATFITILQRSIALTNIMQTLSRFFEYKEWDQPL